MVSKRLNTRCSICNRASTPIIETNIGESTNKNFVPDPKNKLFDICEDCKEAHEELMYHYEVRDFFKKQNLEEGEIETLMADIED